MVDVIYKKCSKCWIEKPATNEFFAIKQSWKYWVDSMCKECKKIYNKTIRSIYRMKNKDIINDKNREWNRTHKEYHKQYKEKRYKDNKQDQLSKWDIRRKNKWYSKLHWKTQSFIKKYNLRPKKCSVCWEENYIFSHHVNYKYWNLIVWCCKSCHELIHSWKIQCPEPIDLTKLVN